MTTPSSPPPSERIYRVLLLALPRSVREQFGEDIVSLFNDRMDEARGSVPAKLTVWYRAIVDLARHGSAQRLRELTRRSDLEILRPKRKPTLMNFFFQDLRVAVRSLLKNPGFVVVAILTLGLGIGASTAIFSVVHAVLLRPLPFEDPERLVMVRGRWPVRNVEKAGLSPGDLADFIHDTTAFEEFAALVLGSLPVAEGASEPEQLRIASVTPNFFSALGIETALGRGFARGDPDDTVVISHGLWQRLFGGDAAVVGKTLTIRGTANTIVGVLPSGLTIHVPEQTGAPAIDTDVWKVRNWDLDPTSANRNAYFLRVFARLAPGVTLTQAQQEADAVAAEHRRLYDDAARVNTQFDVLTVKSQIVDTVESTLVAFMVAIGFVLLIACANVANLLLVRSKAREGEMAVRAALGAGRGRLIRQLLVESLVLALLGGLVGVALAFTAVELVQLLDPSQLPRIETIEVDTTTLAFSLGLSFLTAIVFGWLPAFQGTRASVTDVLRQGGRGTTGNRGRLGRVLIAAEVALSLILLVGAGLLARSFLSLTEVSPGFEVEGTLSFRTNTDPETSAELVRRISGLPGVVAAGRVNIVPLAKNASRGPFVPDNVPVENARDYPACLFRFVTPGYFDAMSIELLRGRFFEQRDMPPVGPNQPAPWVIVDQRLAKQLWPGEDPLGRQLRRVRGTNVDDPSQVIGVVASVREEGLREEGPGTIYFPASAVRTFVVRTAASPEGLVEPVRAALRSLAPESPMYEVRTMQSIVDSALAPARFIMLLSSVFAVAALLLAAVGLYGVISYAVRQRMPEMGIRIVLGAERSSISKLVVGQGIRLALFGVAFGVAGALMLTRLLSAWLYEVRPSDPLTYIAITSLLVAVAAVACYVPARRAAGAEPSAVLREQG